MLPPGFEPGIIGLRSQYAWPDYTTGAYRSKGESQFKAITSVYFQILRILLLFTLNGKKFSFLNFIQNTFS